MRHVGGWCLLRADPSGGSCALMVEQAGPMCGPVNFWYPADFAEQGPFFQGIVCPGLCGVPVGDGQASKGFRDLTGRCSHRDLGLVIPCKRLAWDDHQPTADPSGVRAVHVAMCSVGRVGVGWNRYDGARNGCRPLGT